MKWQRTTFIHTNILSTRVNLMVIQTCRNGFFLTGRHGGQDVLGLVDITLSLCTGLYSMFQSMKYKPAPRSRPGWEGSVSAGLGWLFQLRPLGRVKGLLARFSHIWTLWTRSWTTVSRSWPQPCKGRVLDRVYESVRGWSSSSRLPHPDLQTWSPHHPNLVSCLYNIAARVILKCIYDVVSVFCFTSSVHLLRSGHLCLVFSLALPQCIYLVFLCEVFQYVYDISYCHGTPLVYFSL